MDVCEKNVCEKNVCEMGDCEIVRLLAVELQHLELVDIPLQMVIDMHGTYAHWSARIEQVPRLEGEEAADVGNQRIDGEEHVGCTSLLHGLAVDVLQTDVR